MIFTLATIGTAIGAVPGRLMWSPSAFPPAEGSGAVSLATTRFTPSPLRRALFPSRATSTPKPGASDPSFETVVLAHLNAAYSVARFLTRDNDAAEDVVQDAMLKAYRGFAGYRGGDAKAWLLTIVRRTYIDWSVARRAERGVLSDVEIEEVQESVAEDDATPEGRLVRQGEIGLVRSAIESLPEPFREAIVLRELEEMSYREVAEITGVPIGTVMSRLSRARAMLAERLAPSSLQSVSREAGR